MGMLDNSLLFLRLLYLIFSESILFYFHLAITVGEWSLCLIVMLMVIAMLFSFFFFLDLGYVFMLLVIMGYVINFEIVLIDVVLNSLPIFRGSLRIESFLQERLSEWFVVEKDTGH